MLFWLLLLGRTFDAFTQTWKPPEKSSHSELRKAWHFLWGEECASVYISNWCHRAYHFQNNVLLCSEVEEESDESSSSASSRVPEEQ